MTRQRSLLNAVVMTIGQLTGRLPIKIVVVWLAIVVGTGCHDRTELSIKQVRIALANNRPEKALSVIEQLLQQTPSDPNVLLLKAQTFIQLARLDEGKAVLDQLLGMQPVLLNARLELVDWARHHLRVMLNDPALLIDRDLQDQFDEVVAAGRQQVRWLIDHDIHVVDACFADAQYAKFEANRTRLLLDQAKRRWLGIADRLDLEQNPLKRDLDRWQAQLDAELDRTTANLRRVIELDPQRYDAYELVADYLVQRKQWLVLWSLAQQLTNFKDVPVSAATKFVKSLFQMDLADRTLAVRLQMCRQVLSSVAVSDQDTPQWKLIRARLHLATGEPRKARPLIEATLEVQQDHPEAQHLLAQAFVGLQEYEKAKTILSDLRTRIPESSQVQMLWGLVLMHTGETSSALSALRHATEIDPLNIAARDAYLTFLVERSGLERHSTDLDQYITRHPTDLIAIRHKIQFEHARGNLAAVERWLIHVERMSGDSAQRLHLLIDGLISLKRYRQAESYARQLLARWPDLVDGYIRQAHVQLIQGHDDQFRKSVEKIRERFPNATGVWQKLGELCMQRGWLDLAITYLEYAVHQQADDVDVRVLLAKGLAESGHVDAALGQIDFTLQRDPHHTQAHALAFRIHHMAGRFELANNHLVQLDASQINPLVDAAPLAQIRIRQGKIDQANKICEQAIREGSTDPVLRLIVAAIHLKKGEVPEAEYQLVEMVRHHPNHSQVYKLLGQFYVEQGQVEHGLKILAQFESVNEPLALLGKATLLVGAGRLSDALEPLRRGYESLIRSRSPQALGMGDLLANVHRQTGDHSGAAVVYDGLIDAEMDVSEAKMRQLAHFASYESVDMVVTKLDHLVSEFDGADQHLRFQAIDLYRRWRRHQRALEVIERWQMQQPADAAWYRLQGEILLDMGRLTDGLNAFQSAVSLAPRMVGLRIKLADAYATSLNFPACENVLLEAASLGPQARRRALSNLARRYLQLGLHRKALATCDELAQMDGPKDPAVSFITAQAHAAIGHEDLALQGLARLSVQMPNDVQAQLLMVHLERRMGRIAHAEERLIRLVRNPQTVASTIHALLERGIQNENAKPLILWADPMVNIALLPQALRQQWLWCRTSMAVQNEDWPLVLSTLKQMAQPSDRRHVGVIAGQVAVMIRLKQTDQARQLYLNTPALAESRLGPLLAIAMGMAPKPVNDQSRIGQFLQATAQRDFAAARHAANHLGLHPTLYASDCKSVLARPDLASEMMVEAFRNLCLAWVALEVGLPALGEVVSGEVIHQLPDLVAAHGIHARAYLDQSKSLATGWEWRRSQIPRSDLGLYLLAHHGASQGDLKSAVTDLTTLLDRHPQHHQLRYDLARWLKEDSRIDEAIHHLSQLVRTDHPYKISAANDLAYLLAQYHPDQLDRAYKLARSSLDNRPHMMPLSDTVGWIEHLRGNDRRALRYLNRAVLGLSSVPEVHFHLGIVYQALGDRTWARYHFEQAAESSEDLPEVSQAKAELEKWSRPVRKAG